MAEDPDLSMEDRIQWLRDRGVQIALPSKETSSVKADGEVVDSNSISLCVVMIPANEKEPCEDIHLRIAKDKLEDQLINSLKGVFASSDSVDTSLLHENMSKQFGNTEMHVSESTIAKVAQEGNVEVFPLARPHEKNYFNAVNIYLDEAGQMKRLPPNPRATAIAALCGYKDVPFVGDVFVGRLKVSNIGLRNIDFNLKELKSDAAWLQGVEGVNYEYGIASNMVSMGAKEEVSGGEDAELGYSWTEDETSLEIQVKCPEGVSSSRELTIKISTAVVLLAAKNGEWRLDLQLLKKVSPDDSTWTFNGKTIDLTLEKKEEGLWKKLVAY